MDLFRLKKHELDVFDLKSMYDNSIVVIEWPERIPEQLMPKDFVLISFGETLANDEKQITLEFTPEKARLRNKFLQFLNNASIQHQIIKDFS